MLDTTYSSRASLERLAIPRPAAPQIHVPGGGVIFKAAQAGRYYRVLRGTVRLDDVSDGVAKLAALAFPGDLIGAEVMILDSYAFHAAAVTPCTIEAVTSYDAGADSGSFFRELIAQQLKSARLFALREGAAVARIERLVELLAGPLEAGCAESNSFVLPRLREIEEIVDITLETTSRVIARMQKLGVLREVGRREFVFSPSRLIAEQANLLAPLQQQAALRKRCTRKAIATAS